MSENAPEYTQIDLRIVTPIQSGREHPDLDTHLKPNCSTAFGLQALAGLAIAHTLTTDT
jgi:hypothetical protein